MYFAIASVQKKWPLPENIGRQCFAWDNTGPHRLNVLFSFASFSRIENISIISRRDK